MQTKPEPWEETLAGVVEAVTDEVDLEPRQVTQLINAIGSADMTRQRTENHFRGRPQFEPNEIESVDEFLQRLHGTGPPSYEVRAFARDRFTKNDVPQLLDALRAQTNLRDAEYLHRYGSYLLVRDGLPNPEAAEELSRMLRIVRSIIVVAKLAKSFGGPHSESLGDFRYGTNRTLIVRTMLSHEDPTVRGITVYAFDRYGHPFNEDWAPSEAAVEFGLPWLLKLSNDPEPTVHLAVSEVLGDLAYHHPSRAREVMAALVGMLERGIGGSYTNSSIKRISKVNPEAARASIPQLRPLVCRSRHKPIVKGQLPRLRQALRKWHGR